MEKKTTPSYKEGLTELRGQLKEMIPSKILETFDNDAEQLAENHSGILKLNNGDKVPDFSLLNAVGEKITLSEVLQKGNVVLAFYRGSWCPYCNLQLNHYQQILNKIKEKGASLIAISPQNPDASLGIKEKNNLKFEVLSDIGNIVSRKFTTIFKNDNLPIEAMKNLGLDFDSFYGDDSREIPIPAVFVINQKGIIVFSKTEGGNYRNRVEQSDILDALNMQS
jgi:peroxiredoxin